MFNVSYYKGFKLFLIIISYILMLTCLNQLNMKAKLLFLVIIACLSFGNLIAQTNAPSIQTGVSFQWSDTQTAPTQSATIQSVTVNGIVYFNYGVPVGYTMTQLGPNGHGANNIRLNGTYTETTSASGSWNASALASFQDLNLNHYFEANGNGRGICDNYSSESTTDAQRQTLTYGTGIIASTSGVIAVTERNANNCYHVELFGIPAGGGAEQSLGETFVNQTSTKWGFGGTGSNGNFGTPGAVNPPVTGSDYWLSDRVLENYGTIGIALFYLDDIAPNGSLITKAQLTASTNDHADGKLFILTLPDVDSDGFSDVDDLDDDNDGIKDTDECGGIDPSADDDTDGTPNYQDPDFCTLNAFGVFANLDADKDGLPNHFDLDSDNDGITDVIESGGVDVDNNSMADGTIGITPTTNGIPSSSGSGTNPVNTDSSEDFDFLDIDSDNDGIPDNIEAQTTLGYIGPSLVIDGITGIYNNYGTGLSLTDTDFDGVFDYIDMDSDNDGTPDIEENGMANSVSGTDTDTDGLDNTFETSGVNDATFDVNEDIETPSDLTILPDADGDLASGGDLDYRDLFDVNPPSSATIDFDGVDDYLDSDLDLSGYDQATIMAWVKLDDAFTSSSMVLNFGSLHIQAHSSRQIWMEVNGVKVTSYKINKGEWAHLALIFDKTSASTKLKAYINGALFSTSNASALASAIYSSTNKFTIGARASDHLMLFKGNIDEVRVFDSALTEDQLQHMVYQEIEDNSGYVRGSQIPKDVIDNSTDAKIPWTNLVAYYPMTDIKNATTTDFSQNNNPARLNYIATVQPQTAPMPFVTSSDGNWTSESTWLHGDVWDIEYTPSNKAWSIVKISNDVTACHSIKTLGLIIDSDTTLKVHSDNLVENDWYLELNGTLDLEDDSQLLQTPTSDLVTSSTGKILRRQEGASSPYWYNYWSSPVGATGATSLTDNNTTANNPNNTPFSLNMLKDASGSGCLFTSGYTGSGNISTYWLYTFINGKTYWDWAQIAPSTPLKPGVGYTQKGTGSGGSEQQYIFEGKPNNGTILIDVADVGGPGSVANQSKTEYLMGNPYPSSLDVHKFIDDNVGVIDGYLQLWQQWGGSSHNLSEYQGGYAQVNKTGSIRASQFISFYGAHTGLEEGTVIPTRYLPVGQGFIVEIKDDGVLPFDGTVEFNNSQRVFIKESDADGSYDNGSTFSKTTKGKSSKGTASKENEDNTLMQKIRLEFNSVTGPQTRRELLLGFSNYTTDAYDYGYDSKATEYSNNDLSLDLEGQYMTIQAYASITEDKVVPLNFRSSGDNTFEIRVSNLEHLAADQAIYLKDNETGVYFNLREDTAYGFSSGQGIFNDRFEIVFQSEQQSLSTEESSVSQNYIYYQNTSNTLYVKKLNSAVRKLSLINMRGQAIMEFTDVSRERLENGIQFNNVSTGAYVVCIRTDTNEMLTKKIIVN